MNKWDAKFGFFWYNDEEIFNFTKGDFEEKARKMSETGINIVMTFSCTHFRWSMKEHWPLINRCLKSVVDACHKYGIKVVEHHSSHLTFDPLNDEEWEYMERILNKRHSSIESWKGLREYVDANTVKGTESYRQIDGRTGEWARSNYKGWAKCFNNPEYKKAYFDYLEELYKFTCVDGIMTDDVQYFGFGNACVCEYCTQLFKEKYGNDMPSPGEEWEKFHGDFNNPVYIAWEKFRKDSTIRFQEDVNKHFKSLGIDLLRPNYMSGNITFNWSAYPFEKALHIWDWVFQENCFSFVIKHSWPQFLTESRHRYNMGRLKNIPSMSMFYPDRHDSFYFAWALSMAWGQLFTATPEGRDMCETEKIFREFEKKHRLMLFGQQKKADITIYWSYETANFCNPEICNHITAVKSWIQALTFAGFSTDMVFASEKRIDNNVHKCLLVPDVMMMDDAEYEKIICFVKKGGTVIYTGRPGVKKPDGTYRTTGEMQEGLEMPDEPLFTHNAVEYTVGSGRVILYGETLLDNNYYEPHSVDRWLGSDIKIPLPEYKADFMALKAKELIGPYTEKMVEIITGNELINSYYAYDKSGENMLVHIINGVGTLDSEIRIAGHNDTIPAFMKETKKDFSVDISINIRGIKKAYLMSVEINDEIELKTTPDGGKTKIHIPKGIFSGYGIIKIPL